MLDKPWFTKLKSITPYIFKIATPGGSGTGFQLFFNNRGICGIATAYHVIDHAYEWEEAIRVTHHESQKSKVLKVESRVIWAYPDKDLAFIIFGKEALPIAETPPKLIDPKTTLKQGVEIGWLGFPSVAPPNELCFFAGYTSAYLKQSVSYLVDGVAINGVSGGPAFYSAPGSGEPRICGVVTAYMPNRTYGESLPGLCIVRSVEPYQETLQKLKSLDEAVEKKAEEEEKGQNAPLQQQEQPKPKKQKSTRKSRERKV